MKDINDLGYKVLFSNLTIFREFLESFVHEPWVKDIDFNNAIKIDKSFVSKKYKKTESDVIYKLKMNNEEVYIFVLLEFQSSVDKFMAVRCLNYITNFYIDLIHAKKKTKKKDKSEMNDNELLGKLPPIFPVVLYNGEQNWTAPINISELIENHALLGEFGINFKYLKIVQREYSEKELTKINNIAAGIFLTELNKKNLEPMADKIMGFCDNEDDIHAISLFTNWITMLFLHGKIDDKGYAALEKVYESKNEAKSMLVDVFKEARANERKEAAIENSKKIVLHMSKKGLKPDQISDMTGISLKEVKKFLLNK